MNYFHQIIELFTKHKISQSGKVAFHKWLINKEHSDKKEKALNKLWDNTPSTNTFGLQDSLDSIKEKIGIPSKKKYLRSLRIWQTAAAFLLIISISSILTIYFSQKNTNLLEQYVPISEMRYISLPDGSIVQLNSKSVLLYPKSFDSKTRSVYLLGEANFNVTPNAKKPFIVKSSDFQITVIGTEFNISAYPEDSTIEATVISGTVKATYNNLQSETILSPNQQLSYNRYTQKHLLHCPNIKDVTAWQRGELVFKGTTLQEIISVLERKYPYTFKYSLNSLDIDKYTFRFRDEAALPEVMDIITHVVGNLQYKIEKDNCYLYKKEIN